MLVSNQEITYGNRPSDQSKSHQRAKMHRPPHRTRPRHLIPKRPQDRHRRQIRNHPHRKSRRLRRPHRHFLRAFPPRHTRRAAPRRQPHPQRMAQPPLHGRRSQCHQSELRQAQRHRPRPRLPRMLRPDLPRPAPHQRSRAGFRPRPEATQRPPGPQNALAETPAQPIKNTPLNSKLVSFLISKIDRPEKDPPLTKAA